MHSGLKEQLIKHLQKKIQIRIDELTDAINSARVSRDNETKSSVGDKYETGREMVNFEIEKYAVQLSKTSKLLIELDKINLQKNYDFVEFGSLVYTNQETYFIAIGTGRESLNDESVFCVSLSSPIGKMLQFKKPGNTILFNGKEITITKVI